MILQIIPLIVLLLGITASSYSILPIFNLQPKNSTIRLITNLGFGLILVSFGTLILAVLQKLTADNIFLFFIFLVAIGFKNLKLLLSDIQNIWNIDEIKEKLRENSQNIIQHWFKITAVFGILINLIILILATFTPPTGWDALNYHLAVPKIYLANQGLLNLPTLFHSHFPLPIQFQNIFFMAVSSDIVAQALQLVFFLGTLILVDRIRHRFLPESSTFITILILFTVPVFLFIVPEGHVDMAATFYATLSLFLFLEYRYTRESKYLTLSFVFVGYLSATKFTNLPFLPILMLMTWLLWKLEYIGISKLKNLFLIVVSSLISLAWYAKSWVYAGNPFWPYFFNVFPSKYAPNIWFDSSQIPAISGIVEAKTPIWQNILTALKKILTKPWRGTFFPEQFGGDRPKIGPILLGLSPTLLALKLKRKHHYTPLFYISLFAGLYFVLWLVFFHNTRYLAPIMPAFALLLSAGIGAVFYQRKWLTILIQLILIGSLGLSSLITVKLHLAKIPAALGQVTTDEYYRTLEHPLAGGIRIAEYSTSEYANQNIDSRNSKVLILQGLFGYFLNLTYERGRPDAQSKYDYSKIETVEDLLTMLDKNKVTHILTRFAPEPTRERTDFTEEELVGIQAQSKRGYEILEFELIPEHAELLYSENDIYLYRIKY